MQKPISITSISSISPLGESLDKVWKSYQNEHPLFIEKKLNSDSALVAEIPKESKQNIDVLRESDPKYKKLDDSVLYAIYASRQAIKKAKWNASDNFGINIGSSRGATALFEKYYKDFLKQGKSKTLSSPTTTLGNISSWVAHDLQTKGPEISHSITCSTGLHAVLNGVAWVNSGMTNKFLVGGSEAPLTPFTIAQMKALKVYAKHHAESVSASHFPCQSFNLEKKQNTMVLGEAASVACLEASKKENALAVINGIGYATEILEHNISISTEATCFQKSMTMALANTNPDDIDAVVMHAPGTIKGDISEYNAIKKVFCNKTPFLTTNKWKVGHTFATSGMLSLELAILMLLHQKAIEVPFTKNQPQPKQLKNILVNAVGFGGNAVSILLSK